ncbi:esterase/lipase family protein [Bradyrhizobium genosp. P]|uniref:esterase/lipase family protein n=1 Tax=Bradyrhizobium genosp. P TaxID=83641 RepID=UPI003CE80190
MPQEFSEDPTRFQSQISASEACDDLFADLYVSYDAESESIAGLRRRRRRAANTPDDPIKTVSLVEENGVLYWRDGIPAPGLPSRRRRASRGELAGPPGTIIITKEFPVLAPNKVVTAVAAIDRRLNQSLDVSLRSRLRLLRQTSDPIATFVLDPGEIKGPFGGSTLLFVHGTFSNATNMLNEFLATTPGEQFINGAVSGDHKYDQVLFFEHPTLAVSPVINALELGRCFAGSSGQIDVVAHSRGGLIVRWWLEAFGSSLAPNPQRPVRVVFAGSPLHGTSLAAPDKLQSALSLVSNIGSFAEATLKIAGAANPFLWVGGKLVEVIVSVTGALAKTPIVDALVALVPGLSGQSAVSNNYELNRLRLGPCAVEPDYYAVRSNFETPNPGWQFWKNFRVARLGDLAADAIFESENDLVVDTASMTDLGDPDFALKMSADICDFGTSDTVWHCNYFRQQKTVDYIAAKFS